MKIVIFSHMLDTQYPYAVVCSVNMNIILKLWKYDASINEPNVCPRIS